MLGQIIQIQEIKRMKDAKENNFLNYDDCNKIIVRKNGKIVELTKKEFELLNIFIENRGIALSREKILELVWGYDFLGETRTVDMHIQKLRKKLELKDEITTVYKLGYRLEK